MRHSDLFVESESISFGGKAHGLWELRSVGALIPPTFCIASEEPDGTLSTNDAAVNAIQRWVSSVDLDTIQWIVRSSALDEDSYSSSKAGINPSKIITIKNPVDAPVMLLETARAVLAELVCSGVSAAVVIQPFVKGELSGIIFSTDPNDGQYRRGTLTYAPGTCLDVVAGINGTSVVFTNSRIPTEELPGGLTMSWNHLLGYVNDLETKWNLPVDAEFTVFNGLFYFLQARPIASISKWRNCGGIRPIDSATPSLHPKIALRKRCLQVGAPVSKGWLATETIWDKFTAPALPSSCYSSVLIHPTRVCGEVRRTFSSDGITATSSLLGEASSYWVRHAVIMEVIDGHFTGIAQCQQGEVLLEIARGHFVPKGVVETAVMRISEGRVQIVQHPIQKSYFEIDRNTGETISKPYGQKVPITRERVLQIQELVSKMHLGPDELLEFGIDTNGQAYVIDIETALPLPIASSTQILSPGVAEGALIVVGDQSSGTDLHIGSISENVVDDGSPTIIATEKPSLAILSKAHSLRREGKKIAGFIFGFYSPLCHLAILLREWGIPAIAADPAILKWPDGVRIRISAVEPNPHIKRLS